MSFDLREFGSYEEALAGFAWDIPASYNTAADVSDRFRYSTAVAARSVGGGRDDTATFAELSAASSALASSLARLGLGRGSRICTVLPQRIETLVTFLAVAKLGGVAITLRWHRDQAWHEHELSVANADAVIVDAELLELIQPLQGRMSLFSAEADTWRRYQSGTRSGEQSLVNLILAGDPTFPTAETSRDDPVLVSFTSGSTGLSKGVVLAHRTWRGARPAFQMAIDLGPAPDDVFFSNLGWSTMAGLRSIVLQAWQFGLPVVACDVAQPTISDYCSVLTREGVSVAYLMPAILKQLRELGQSVQEYDWSRLRCIMSAGEGIGEGLREWLETNLGALLQPYYGTTELAVVVGNCRRWFPYHPGSVGKLVPGHHVMLEADGARSASNGIMVIPADDPGLFMGYLQTGAAMPSGLAEPYVTEDVATVDEGGYYYYLGRAGDVIELPGGRQVAAAEIEDPVARTPGVRDACALQVREQEGPSALALCLLVDQAVNAEELIEAVRELVERDLPEDAWPREVVLLTAFPRTQLTNKVNRKLLRTLLAEGSPSLVMTRACAGKDLVENR